MWSNVVVEGVAPPGRCKHAVALAGTDLYLYGGKSGPTGLRDFWKLELHAGEWGEIKAQNPPPPLQEHTLVHHKDKLYLFGGQMSAETQTPLWIYSIKENVWRKWEGESMAAPSGRRGHIAGVYSAYMLIHGGYRDFKGSQGDLWAFHFETESWHLFYRHSPPPVWSGWADQIPDPRHSHSGITHGGFLYVHGGMFELEDKSDFWKFDLGCRRWSQLKAKPNPGKLKCSSVSKAQGFMFLFGGERDGKVIDEFWRFSFDRETWEKISFYGSKPGPRHLPAVAMLPAIIKIRNIPIDSSYWWDNANNTSTSTTTSTTPVDVGSGSGMGARVKNVNVVLRKLGGHYQMIGSQTVEECGVGDEDALIPSSRSGSSPKSNYPDFHSDHVPKTQSEKWNEFKRSYSTSDYSSMETLPDGRERSSLSDPRVRLEHPHMNHGPESFEMESFREMERFEVTTPNYLLVIGGYDAQNRHFGRVPMSIWRLRVSHELFV